MSNVLATMAKKAHINRRLYAQVAHPLSSGPLVALVCAAFLILKLALPFRGGSRGSLGQDPPPPPFGGPPNFIKCASENATF